MEPLWRRSGIDAKSKETKRGNALSRGNCARLQRAHGRTTSKSHHKYRSYFFCQKQGSITPKSLFIVKDSTALIGVGKCIVVLDGVDRRVMSIGENEMAGARERLFEIVSIA